MNTTMTGRSLRPAMRTRAFATLALAAGLMTSAALPALAGAFAPLPPEPYVPAPQYSPAPAAAHWDGTYAGFTMGYNFRGTDEVQLAPAPPGVIGTMRARGVLLGVQAGHNWQSGAMVYGVEGGLNLSRTRDSVSLGTASASMRINPVADLRGRVGYAINDGLVYAAGGLSIGRVRYAASDGLNSDIASTYNAVGYTVGLGYEQQIGNNWSMRGEYSYSQYRGRDLSDGVHTTRATPDFHSVRFGLNRRF